MNAPLSISSSHGMLRKRSYELRCGVLACFSEPAARTRALLTVFDDAEWRRNLKWLDTSGLALYLLERLMHLGCEDALPAGILDRLMQNLKDNTVRNADLLAEAGEIARRLEGEGVLFSHMKGITLTPASVPEARFRLQLDLDFLVLDEDAEKAARVLEEMGYARACISGDTWEFKAGGAELPTLEDLYKAKPQRSAEMHLAPREGLLSRVAWRSFGSVALPALPAPDLYLQQALHLFKHLRGSFTRAAWLLEYRRHMLARMDDSAFWAQLEALTWDSPKTRVALGAVSLLVAEVFGDELPSLLAGMTDGCLSVGVRLWIRRYGRFAVLADFPGTKLYLILQGELDSSRVPLRGRLLPLTAPPMITLGHRGESLRSKLRRGWIQCGYLGSRLRFHSVEGVRYFVEMLRFRRLVAELMP